MSIKKSDNLITIPKRIVEKQGGAVVLGLHEYKRLLGYEMEKEQIDAIVKDGAQEYKEGKTEPMESFLKREYPNLYEDYKN
ncbi:MAG: hypothetical protein HQ539_03780 [Parcubacteria group bacterium]|nr:hypothetical protein [Parcubacteria group bacterium]